MCPPRDGTQGGTACGTSPPRSAHRVWIVPTTVWLQGRGVGARSRSRRCRPRLLRRCTAGRRPPLGWDVDRRCAADDAGRRCLFALPSAVSWRCRFLAWLGGDTQRETTTQAVWRSNHVVLACMWARHEIVRKYQTEYRPGRGLFWGDVAAIVLCAGCDRLCRSRPNQPAGGGQ